MTDIHAIYSDNMPIIYIHTWLWYLYLYEAKELVDLRGL